MRAETKIQVRAIKKGDCMIGKAGDTVMITEGHFIVYMPKEQCRLDISRFREMPQDAVERYSLDAVEKLMEPIKLTKKAVLLPGSTVRLLKNESTGKRIWINKKYIKMFPCSAYYSARINGQTALVCVGGGRIRGLILPVTEPESGWE